MGMNLKRIFDFRFKSSKLKTNFKKKYLLNNNETNNNINFSSIRNSLCLYYIYNKPNLEFFYATNDLNPTCAKTCKS